MKIKIIIFLMAFIAGHTYGQPPAISETISVNGIELYYEKYGEGDPLLLLHGWTQSSQFWKNYLPVLTEKYEVYVIDLRGHGRTTPLSDDFSIPKTAEDLKQFLVSLQLEKVNAVGLSYGGLALLQLACSHPERINAMVLIGTARNYNGADNTNLDDSFSFDNLPGEFVDQLRTIHHHGEGQIKGLFDQNLDYKIHIPEKTLKNLDVRTLIIQGDQDEIIGVGPAVELHQLLPFSRLWIVPGTGHNAIEGENQSRFIETTIKFLDDVRKKSP